MDTPDESDPWSISKPALYRELQRSQQNDETIVLATIVNVEGSAYRRPGAKMLISADNESLGAVTAGCLEEPVVDLASTVREEERPQVETFDLMDDEWGLGLGCNGIIDILLEPVDASIEPVLAALHDRRPVTVVTAVRSDNPAVSIGARTVISTNGDVSNSHDRSQLPKSVVDAVKTTAETIQNSGKATICDISTSGGDVQVFIDSIEPSPRLLLFGNQNDVHPVSRFGRQVGFEVIVASARGSRSSSSDFPCAHEVYATHPTDIHELTDERTYVVLMSHNLLDDQLALESLQFAPDVPYIGLMGPQERFEQICDKLAKDGTAFTADQLERVSTPVGLDLGGGEPMQIALSIVSEVLAIHNERTGGRLKDKKGPIHDRVSIGTDGS
ncbi:XdhC family protein [Halorarum salinum]|uniref:XdhC family protein n=1 Tax=Halorarum salinum TaxID=2743089 RepID=A0A7D5L895_9EURY|nr:XdhC family protein [Halobaculum salinum]QLG60334.1 XdhC family protein [Halobaculum salinum]